MQFSLAAPQNENGDVCYCVYLGDLPLGKWTIECWHNDRWVSYFDLEFLFDAQYFPIYVWWECNFWKVRDSSGELVGSGVIPQLVPRQEPLRVYFPPEGNSLGDSEGWILHAPHSEWNLLINPGMQKFPRIERVFDGDTAHLVVHTFVGMERSHPPPNPRWRNRTIMLDYGDLPWVNFLENFPLYFKRSWLWKTPDRRVEMGFGSIPHVRPLTYCIKECEGETGFDVPSLDKDLDVVCHFEPDPFGTPRQRTAFHVSRLLSEGYSGHIGLSRDYEWPDSYGGLTKEYFSQMKRAKVVVCCNPECWEGDFRLYEAVTSGAVVFCDCMYKTPPELADVVEWYDLHNPEDLLSRIRQVLANPEEWKGKSLQLESRAAESCLPKHHMERIIRSSSSLFLDVDLEWVLSS